MNQLLQDAANGDAILHDADLKELEKQMDENEKE